MYHSVVDNMTTTYFVIDATETVKTIIITTFKYTHSLERGLKIKALYCQNRPK